MRFIHVEDGLRLRFPGRDAAFNEGVEIGILAVNLASGRGEFTLQLSSGTLEQARASPRRWATGCMSSGATKPGQE